jgi:hypothetical protein
MFSTKSNDFSRTATLLTTQKVSRITHYGPCAVTGLAFTKGLLPVSAPILVVMPTILYVFELDFYVRDDASVLTFCMQKPTGAFQSHFIINVAKKYLRYAEKSLLKPKIDAKLNPSVGLFGMILLSVYFLQNYAG